ncbi:DUF4278 domain-containing protein [Chamaesiphon minutus]|uniref:DUF4278 domain-containing protein n=1 Tax=Chamaesiphon minutus (strain ATCC 27169 / PCC 6605) TaxID=1173020 RepID=K9UQQ4_CHAP6|nr:DUF4278 domain-containing protein [Chamaesiphon minutus]AFY96766.1 hypothetical protein Cha6605_5919 [Chamaesiphon minutus PCC 6605]
MTNIIQRKSIESKVIKLIYRGITYNYDPDRVRANSPLPHSRKSSRNLIYRGVAYRFDLALAKPDVVKPCSYELIYRGSTYQAHRNEKGEVSYQRTSH